jgi:hypothetical protein
LERSDGEFLKSSLLGGFHTKMKTPPRLGIGGTGDCWEGENQGDKKEKDTGEKKERMGEGK